ncbi:hypothetical protein CPB86DRAFT_801212 [Serendipita vermifera]|nr:hypothetical protein CPB86DRAFT_801212 [Serendipita vermifera]
MEAAPVGSQVEFQLLPQTHRAQSLGEHELKTSPLLTKDSLDLCIAQLEKRGKSANGNAKEGEKVERFSQRGLLGRVTRTHSENLKPIPGDVRLYMNLDAPSSGLVCGVQGSGKSHTVSCILESSLMVDRGLELYPPHFQRLFHFDKENGGQPCEAAFLSELRDRSRGVEEVVVPVSPTSLKKRRTVYEDLKHVKVEPLRIAEKEMNAARMLSMMGADNLDRVPLYLRTALSILREMGSDKFDYKDFKKRVTEKGFNQGQNMMLQLRFDLLDSFLKGKEADISSYFKAGRLITIDLSDPFVNGTTATMLFDICLGMFIEWKVSVGKLIGTPFVSFSFLLVSLETVLDEAHKYLTNSDANQFTKKISSIIRQQRHLAARVVISTQEPTVVPASVLGLLSWIICHRFSSPAWVKHLHGHICVNDKKDDAEKKKGQYHYYYDEDEDEFQMNLSFSPASLFVSKSGQLATLSTGYASIMTRARLTKDGGASIFATGDTVGLEPLDAGILTPSSIGSDPGTPSTQGSSDMELAKTQFGLPPKPQVLQLRDTKPSSGSEDVKPPIPSDVEEYEMLIDIMNRVTTDAGSPWIKSSSLANAYYRANPEDYPSSFRGFIRKIALTRVVLVHGEGVEFQVALHPSLRANQDKASQASQKNDRDSLSPDTKPLVFSVYDPRYDAASLVTPQKDPNPPYPTKFHSLVNAIRKFENSPGEWVKVSQIGSLEDGGGYEANGYKTVMAYIEAAQDAGIIVIRGRARQKHVSLIL